MAEQDFEKKLLGCLENIVLNTSKHLLNPPSIGSLVLIKTQVDVDYILIKVLGWEADRIRDFHKQLLEKMGVRFP